MIELKLRPIAYECIRFEVRNGVTVHFWFDNWLEMGRLIDITGELGISYLGVSKSATLAEATATTAGTFGDVDRDDTPTCVIRLQRLHSQ